LVAISLGSPVEADYRTARGMTGVVKYDKTKTQPGYLFVSTGRNIFFFDMEGYIVKRWTAVPSAGSQPVFTREGHALISRGGGGDVPGSLQEQDWDGNEVRVYWPPVADSQGTPRTHRFHHRMSRIEDVGHPLYGHVLQAVYRDYTKAEAIAAGRTRQTANTFVSDVITVYDNSNPAQVVWEWDFYDHLGLGYDKVDPNMPTSDTDFAHINSCTYDSVRNWVLFNSNNQSEFWAVNRDTKQIVYRFGNPANWDKTKQYATANAANLGAISLNDRWSFNVHDIRQITPGGNLMLFNNGNFPTGRGSIVYEINPEQDKVMWRFPGSATATTANAGANPTLWSQNQSGANRLPNGNTVMAMSNDGHVVEATREGEIVWEFKYPMTGSGAKCFYNDLSDMYSYHCAFKYPADHPGFVGKDLVTGRYRPKACPYDSNPIWKMTEPEQTLPTVVITGARTYIPGENLLVRVDVSGPDVYDVYFSFQIPGSTNRYYTYALNLAKTSANFAVPLAENVGAGTYPSFQFVVPTLGYNMQIPVRAEVMNPGFTTALATADATVGLNQY
jgi:hypothetical protein